MNVMNYFFKYFPFFFIGMWVLVEFIISKMGWSGLASKYKSDTEFIGNRIGIISASINFANYRNVLILKYNDEGIYLKPIILFRLFHPPILIPWSEIKEVRDKRILLFHLKQFIIGDPIVAKLEFYNSTFKKFKDEFTFRTKLK